MLVSHPARKHVFCWRNHSSCQFLEGAGAVFSQSNSISRKIANNPQQTFVERPKTLSPQSISAWPLSNSCHGRSWILRHPPTKKLWIPSNTVMKFGSAMVKDGESCKLCGKKAWPTSTYEQFTCSPALGTDLVHHVVNPDSGFWSINHRI